MPDDALGAAMWDPLNGEYDGSCVHRDPETGEAWVDSYDPRETGESHGHRATDEDGIGRRRFRVEYRGRDAVGPPLEFRTFSPDRLRSVCAETRWGVAETAYAGEFGYFRARLAK